MTAAWPDGTAVTVLVPHELAGEQGLVVDWIYAFASERRRYWVQLEERHEPVHIHESELQREEPS